MIFKEKFIAHLLRCLKNSEYLLFEHFAIYRTIPKIPFNILLRKKDHRQVIAAIKSFVELENFNTIHYEGHTELQIELKDQTTVQLNIWENLVQNNTTFLNSEMIFSKRQRSKSEFYMPNIEHLFEFAVLVHFLNEKALPLQYLNYFEDFHFFVKDGLLEFFNHKYGTSFVNLDELASFDITSKELMLSEIERAPDNQFFNKINMQWKSLWRAPNA